MSANMSAGLFQRVQLRLLIQRQPCPTLADTNLYAFHMGKTVANVLKFGCVYYQCLR